MLTSILDNDLYKFTMQNAVIKLFPRAKARFQFTNRAGTIFPVGFDIELRKAIENQAQLKLTLDERKFISDKCYYIDPTFVDFIAGYNYDPSEVTVTLKDGKLTVDIEGLWYRTILWEVPLMAMISELYFKLTNQLPYSDDKIIETVINKVNIYNELDVRISDFGTRRRYSHHVHDLVVKTLKEKGSKFFTGTSNVHFAHKYNVTPIGTHAHEWFMFHAAKYGFKMANYMALEHWSYIYRGDLGIALSDTYTTNNFFESFDTKFAKLFDGLRHDSADPKLFADKTIEHYKKLKIDPTTKNIVFSDALNPESVKTLSEYCKGKIRSSFGIGTNFTNDVGVKPLNMVIKMSEANPNGDAWISTVKLSDVEGKHSGTTTMIDLCKKVLNLI